MESIPNAGHALFYDRPEVVNGRIVDFLSRCPCAACWWSGAVRELQGEVLVEGREDRAALFEYEEGVVAVVADGAGGTGGGAEAAQAVIDAVRRQGWSAQVDTWVGLLGRLDHSVYPGQTTSLDHKIPELGSPA